MGLGVTRRSFVSFAAAAATTALVSRPRPARAQVALRLTLDGRLEGPSGPFLVALEQGYFKNEGLEVLIEPSAGANEPFTRVAGGGFDVGFADINAMIRYRDQTPASTLKAVFVVNNRPGYAVIGRKSRGVEAPQDLEGKRVALPPAELASAAWPIFARANTIDPNKVRMLAVGLPVREPMLAAGEVDAVTGSSWGTPINLREKGVPGDDISTILMGSYGVDLYGASIFFQAKTLAEKPEAVRSFLRGFARGLKDTIRDPGAVAAALVRRNGTSTRELELERLQTVIRDSIVTEEVRSTGLGMIEPARFDSAIAQLATVHNFRTRLGITDLFDPSFLPPEEDRRIE
jgi:NitT/TauT family transport system substrate-binding protein